jgi:hypothetical protein
MIFVLAQIAASYITKIVGDGVSMAELSEIYPFPLLPAKYVFAIWGLLFPLLIAYAIYQILPANSRDALLEKIGFKTAGAFFITTVWLLVTQLGNVVNVDFIFSLATLASLLWAMFIIEQHYLKLSTLEYCFVYVPISMLSGWITVAALLTVSSFLEVADLNLWQDIVSIALLVMATIFVLAIFFLSNGNNFYIAPVIWGMIGIWQGSGQECSSKTIGDCALICAFILVVVIVKNPSKSRGRNIFKRI